MMVKVRTHKVPRVCQGDIYSDVEMIDSVRREGDYISVSTVRFPLVIVLTQDCDLAQDYRVRWSRLATPKNDDKKLFSVLVAPVYNHEHVIAGTHLSELNLRMTAIQSTIDRKRLTQNETPRYHFLHFPSNCRISDSVIDFKHYFSVNVVNLKGAKKSKFVCKVAEVYREQISLRFANFLSRIGLPD